MLNSARLVPKAYFVFQISINKMADKFALLMCIFDNNIITQRYMVPPITS